jgi:hypothetical protein
MDDPRSIWQNQAEEPTNMTTNTLRGRARRLESRVKARSMIFFTALTAHILLEVGPYFVNIGPSLWLGAAELSTFIVWVIYYPYIFAARHRFITLSDELAAPGLAFYRKQLESLSDDYPAKLQIAFIVYYVVIHAAWNPALIIPVGILGGLWAYYSRKRASEHARTEIQSLLEFQKQEP